MSESPRELSELLETHRSALLRWVAKNAQGLLKKESAEDVVQGIQLRALKQQSQFDYRGEKEFLAWIFLVSQQHVSDRHDYWSALRREAGRMLRVTASDGHATGASVAGVNPTAGGVGPGTYASRREMMEIAARALDLMLPRDRKIIQWVGLGRTNQDLAEALAVGYDAAEQAKRRALERFRKTVELISRKRSS